MGDTSNLDISWRSALLLALVVPLMASIVVLWWRDVERTAGRYLGLMLLVYCAGMMPQILGFANFYQVWPGLTFAPFDLELLLGPAIYLHVWYLTQRTAAGWRAWLLVFPVVQICYYLWAFLLIGDYRAKWDYAAAFHSPYVVPAEAAIAIVLALGCAIASWRLIQRYRQYLNSTQSTALEFDPSWLRRLLTVIPVLLSLWAILTVVDQFVTPISYGGEFPVYVLIGALLLWTTLEALSRIRTPFPKMPSADTPGATAEPATRDWKAEGKSLDQQLRHEQWYLNSALSLRDVARLVGSNESYISRAINTGLGINFNQFVNLARVQHAKALMSESPNQNLLDIAADSGFNSKATFNRVFKLLTGEPPSRFRANQAQQP